MRIDLTENEARRYERATVLVVPCDWYGPYWWCDKCYRENSPVQVTYEETCIFCGEPVQLRETPNDGEPPVRPGDVLDVAEPFVRYQIVRRVKTSDGRSFSEVDDGQVAYQADGHDLPADAAHHYRLIGGIDIEHIELEDSVWRPASEMPDWAIRHHPRVVSVTAKMLGQLNWLDWSAMGHTPPPGRHHVDSLETEHDKNWCWERFHTAWTADHGEWQPERWVYLLGIEKGATT